MAKTQYLEFEIHLTDPDRVKTLQASPPGQTSVQGTTKAIIRAPAAAAVEFGASDNGGINLPMVSIVDPKPASGPYIVSKWFTVSNPDWSRNFPVDVSTFTRKSGGWFGISFLFGTTTRFYWRGVFVYDAPQDAATGGTGGGTRAPIGLRRWIDPMSANAGSTPGSPNALSIGNYSISRDAGSAVDGLGFAMRGISALRVHTLTEHTGGGVSADNISWERLNIRLRKSGTGEQFWRCRGTVSNAAGAVLGITPTGQIAVYNVDQFGAYVLVGTTAALTVNKLYKLDVVVRFARPAYGGTIWLFLNGQQVLNITVPAGTGLGQQQFHQSSEIGTAGAGYDMELDIGFWNNVKIATNTDIGGVTTPDFTSLDFVNGSKAVLVRANGNAAGGAGWTGDVRTLAQFPVRDALGDKWISTTANAEIRVTTDTALSIDAMPGSLGCVALFVNMFGHRGTLQGQFGYKLAAAARVLATCNAAGINPEGAGDISRAWSSMMFNLAGGATTPTVPFPALELHRLKGNDAVQAGTAHLSAVAELIGTFGDQDYPVTAPAGLRNPLPYLGPHNAPYPRTPWARQSTPPFSPLIIKAGTYLGNGTGQDLQFKTPVHFLWIRHTTGAPKMGRWFSSLTGALLGGEKTPYPWLIPDEGLDATFVSVPAGGAATGVGALPDRSGQVATIVNANLGLLDGNENHKRDLLGVIVRALNNDNVGDGNNWGFLTKTERDPDFVPADIIVWKPTLDHIDVLSDTGPTWINNGPIPNPAWIWTAVAGEGSQEERTIVRIAGADPEVNQAGETYQYLAISDPGQRFMLNGAISHHDVNATGAAPDALIDTRFLPEFVFFADVRPGADTNIISGVKGPGHAAGAATLIDAAGTQRAGALDMALGSLTLGNTLNFNTDIHLCYSAFRRDDGSNDPGIPRVCKIGTYTGNGAGTRSIALAPASGKRPLWAIIVPHGAIAYMKDSSHAGGNATAMNGGSVATAIISGDIDLMTVGATLNANAVLYNYFVVMGDSVGNADGWSINGEFVPVEPTSPTGSQWGADAEPPTDLTPTDNIGADTPGTPGGGTDDIDTDLDVACLPFTQRIVNIALSRIGVGKLIQNLSSDLSQEATMCRVHLGTAIEQTLRDFAWPFATRYADLVLLDGATTAPVNRDWTFSYQQPSDCIFPRRIVVTRDGAVDPMPPPFQLSFDNVAKVTRLFTNQASARLEYTARPECSAGRGDALFRDALAWRLAHQLAGPLTRVTDIMKHCEDRYEAAIEKARQVLKPGNPGPKTTLDPDGLDVGVGAIAANVAVANRGLLRIGARTIANLADEQSREATAVRLIFEEELRSVLRDYPWAFATRYVATPTLVSGSAGTPANDDWTYAYRYPTDAVEVRRIVTEKRRGFNPAPEMFRVGGDDGGRLVFCNRLTPTLEYTARIPNCVQMADALFRDAFAWRLAAALALALATIDPELPEQFGRGPQDRPRERKVTETQLRSKAADSAMRMYHFVLEQARAADGIEQQQDVDSGDADWIRDRD